MSEEREQYETAADAWRAAKSPSQAWKLLRDFVARVAPDSDDDGNVPYWTLSVRSFEAWFGPKTSAIAIFQKRNVMNAFLGESKSRPEKSRIAVYQAPFTPQAFDTKLIRSIVKLSGARSVGFVGDVSPYGLHLFGALRSGDMNAPRLDAKAPLNLKWLGIDDAWLRSTNPKDGPLARRLVMSRIEREYWAIVKRLMPGVHKLIGPKSYALLDEGFTVQSDEFRDVMGDDLVARIGRVRRAGRGKPKAAKPLGP